ncbi:hypothetical protein [Streptomyces sp. NPDC003730]
MLLVPGLLHVPEPFRLGLGQAPGLASRLRALRLILDSYGAEPPVGTMRAAGPWRS